MNLRHIRPEDRRRSDDHGHDAGTGTGHGADWADTVPACFRSEAFAEDLAPGDPGPALPTRVPRPAVPRAPRRSRAWLPLVALSLATFFGLRGPARN